MKIKQKIIIFCLLVFLPGSIFAPWHTVAGEPKADPAVMQDTDMVENDTYDPLWTLGDVFYDDVDPDPDFTYSLSNNGSLWVHCPNGQPLGPNNQCEDVRFVAVDGRFPHDTPVTITFTATNGTGGSASDNVLITVHHINHMPEVIPGIDDTFEMDEDTSETLNLKEYFRDLDVGDPGYPTSDALTYDKDGEEHITVTITGSKAKLEPEENWNGEEVITFAATDKAAATVEFDLTVIIDPVNDPPVKTAVSPELDPSVDEVDDGAPNTVSFTAEAEDVDGDELKYSWSVEDSETGAVYDPIVDGAGLYEMKLDYDCDFANFVFCGRDSSTVYIVTSTVTDGMDTVELKKWFISVRNVNRDPLIKGVKVYQIDQAGSLTAVTPVGPANYTLEYGGVYRLDAGPFITDLDEGIVDGEPAAQLDKLTVEWTSDRSGVFGTDSHIDVAAGMSSAMAPATLATGTHVVTIRVTDADGGGGQYSFTAKVQKNQQPDLEIDFARDGDDLKDYETSGAAGEKKELKVKVVVKNTGEAPAVDVHIEVRDEDGDKLGETTIDRLEPGAEKEVAVKIKVETGESTGPMTAEATTTYDGQEYSETTTEGPKARVVQSPGFGAVLLVMAIILVMAGVGYRKRR